MHGRKHVSLGRVRVVRPKNKELPPIVLSHPSHPPKKINGYCVREETEAGLHSKSKCLHELCTCTNRYSCSVSAVK